MRHKLTMPKEKVISDGIKKKVLTFCKSGESYKTISKRLQLHPSSVRQTILKWRAFNTIVTLPRSWRPSKISPRNTRKIISDLKAYPSITFRELQTSVSASGVNVYVFTIRHEIDEHTIHWRAARRKPLLSTKKKAARLNYAGEYLTSGSPFSGQMNQT